MKKLIAKLYKKAPNGKMELLGVDGLNHLVIDVAVMLGVLGATLLVVNREGGNPHYWMPRAALWTWLVMRVVWFVIEWRQEMAMTTREPEKNPLKWSRARWAADQGIPFLGGSVVLAAVVLGYR